MQEIEITGEMIRLGQLLKLAGVLDSGAQAREFLSANEVLVNGEREQRRGRQLRDGDTVVVAGLRLGIATAPGPPGAPEPPEPSARQ